VGRPIIFSSAKVISKELVNGKGGVVCWLCFSFIDGKYLHLVATEKSIYETLKIGNVVRIKYRYHKILSVSYISDDTFEPVNSSKAQLISKISKKSKDGKMFFYVSFQFRKMIIREFCLTKEQFNIADLGDIVELEYQGNSVLTLMKNI